MSAADTLAGRVLLVTGAGRGIGRAIAEVAAASGAAVAINALTSQYAGPAAAGLARQTGAKVVPVIGDVTTPEGAAAVVDQAVGLLGEIDILVNNLGDSDAMPLISLPGAGRVMKDEDVERILALNLGATIACTRAAGRYLIRKPHRKVISISSFAAAAGGGGNVIYTTAKTALSGFTRALALEWAPYRINVNAIAPGYFPDPAMAPGLFQSVSERAATAVPLGRAGQLREIGVAACFLASAAADYITGQTIFVDGGLSL